MMGTPRRRRQGLVRDERGSAAESVIVFPVLIFGIMAIIQIVLYVHAVAVAEAAAQDGAAVARRADGSTVAAASAAHKSLASLSPKMLTARDVSVRRTPTEASVTVTGRVVALVPLLDLRVRETATGPVERFVPETGR